MVKVKIGDKEYEFKHITLPADHGFDEKQLKFLQTLDEALVTAREGVSKKEDMEKIKTDLDASMKAMKADFDYDKIQAQLNDMYIKMNEFGASPLEATKEQNEAKELQLNNDWVRALLKKDKVKMAKASKELKTLTPIMHLGPATGTDAGDLSEDYTQGGYLVPELFTAEIHRYAIDGGVARREMAYMPFVGAGNTRKLNYQVTNVAVTWIDEAEIKGKTKPTTGQITQTLETCAAICILTEDLVEDSAFNFVSWVAQLIAEAIAAEEDDQFFAGAGAPFTGILTTAGTVGYALDATVGPLNMAIESLLNVPNSIPTGAVAGAKFYMHRTVWAAICSRRSDSVAADDSRGLFLSQVPGQGTPSTIWGYPVVLTEALPSLGDIYNTTDAVDVGQNDLTAEGDEPFIIFGNLKKTCVYGDKKGIRVKLLDQATVTDSGGNLINLAEQDMLAVRVHKRVGYAVVLASGICIISTGPTS